MKLTKWVTRLFSDPELVISRGEEDVSPLSCEQFQGCLDDFVVVRDVSSNDDTVFDVLCVWQAAAPALCMILARPEETFLKPEPCI